MSALRCASSPPANGPRTDRGVAFDDLKPQPPRTAENTRYPAPAPAYGARALALSRRAAAGCRTVLDIAFGEDYYQKLDLYLPDPPAAKDVPVLLYFHGGAWMHGYKEWNGFLAPCLVDLPAIFVSASYRIAPEHKFPASLEDAFAALQWVDRNIADHGGDARRIFVAGWSVGATLAALLTLRRELYADYGLADDVIKACFACSGGFEYPARRLAPGNSGRTYGDILYARPADDRLAAPLHYAAGNRTPFHISHGANDIAHVIDSSAATAGALRAQDCVLAYERFDGLNHYQTNLAQAEPANPWITTVRAWMSQPPVAQDRA